MIKKMFKKLSRAQIIALSFIVVILIGALLLMLPFATRSGGDTTFLDALFIATSATSGTGFTIYDTYSHWTFFGQLIILILIQIGGLGFLTIMTTVTVLMGRNLGLRNRILVMESTGNISLSGIGGLVKRILKGTLLFEGVGACILATQFVPIVGWKSGIFSSVFHSVSAFCTAGLDVMGEISPNNSLSMFYNNAVVNFTLIALMIIGGIGFYVWSDLSYCKFKVKRLQLHTKLVIVTTAILMTSAAVMYFAFEYNNALSGMSLPDKIMSSAFQAVTASSTGFFTVNNTALSEPSKLITLILMFIGGSPGSTGGGIKTTTMAVIVLSAVAYAQADHDVTIFKCRVEEKMMRRASAITFIYFSMSFVSTLVICAIEKLHSFENILFEVISAVGNCGLSMGLVSSFTSASKIIIIILMYAGRIGCLTFVLMLSRKTPQALIKRPNGKILIG